MFSYFKLKPKAGTKNRYLYFVTKKRKWSNKEKAQYISKKSSILIEGLHASGKTREIEKLYKRRNELWGNKHRYIYLKATDSLADWLAKNLNKEIENEFIEEHKDEEEIVQNIKRQHVRIAQLVYASEGSILMIDDIDKLQGKKKEIIKDLIKASKVTIATTSNYKEMDKTIQKILERKGIEILNLTTEVSYDATFVLFAVFVITLFAIGQHELAILVMAGRYAMKGIQSK